ncbi:MAG TPA: nuclear transport factor 2 family protein [Gaiellaceae bacterium]|nr:nuclear transport factor 2 family protein [Gaiellaceae bacterium]
MSAAALVRRLYEAYQARDWESAGVLVHEDAVLEMPATRERLTGRTGVIALQRAYPEPWGDLSVLRVVGEGDTAAAEIEVVAPDATFRMAAFWRSEGGLLRDGAEYWITVGGDEPPPNREHAPG